MQKSTSALSIISRLRLKKEASVDYPSKSQTGTLSIIIVNLYDNVLQIMHSGSFFLFLACSCHRINDLIRCFRAILNKKHSRVLFIQ
jgi:hypothetical protein